MMLKFLEKVNWNDPNIDKTSELIASELKRFHRVVVQGVIANAGRTPFSVSGRMILSIDSQGHLYTDPANPNTPSRISKDIHIDLMCVDEGLLNEKPSIQIAAGGVTPFIAISRKYLYQIDDEQAIRALYGSPAEKSCRIEMKRLDKNEMIVSPDVTFREQNIPQPRKKR